jgi:hypothetical protein
MRGVGLARGHRIVAAMMALAVVLLGLVSWATVSGRSCAPLTAAEVTRDEDWTRRFAAFGNDNSRADDWTGADGTWSVRLPDGRMLWIFADTFLGVVGRPPNLFGEPYHWRFPHRAPLIRNSALLQNHDGSFTMLRGARPDGLPGSWITRPGQPDSVFWPMSAVLEPEWPGSSTLVVRVFAVEVAPPVGRHVFGVLTRGAVATFGLDDLARLRGFVELPPQPPPNAEWTNQVFYGSQALVLGDHVYIYGGTGNSLAGGQSAYLARVLLGSVADPTRWEFWQGRAPDGRDQWSPRAEDARPVLPWTGLGAGHTGVSAGYSVTRVGGTYVLFTMDTTRYAGGISRIASYWACGPAGPWHGPSMVYDPPEVRTLSSTYSYFPIAHPQLSAEPGELVLSYDLNADFGDVHRDVGLYRPRFLRVRLAPSRYG